MEPHIRARVDIHEPLKSCVLKMSPGQLKTAFAKFHKTFNLSFAQEEAQNWMASVPMANWMASVPMAYLYVFSLHPIRHHSC